MSQDLKNSFKERILGILSDQIKRALILGLRKWVMKILKIIILGIIGAIIIGAGVIFLCISIYNYISMFVEPWIAWLIMGFVSVLIGLILLLAAYLSR